MAARVAEHISGAPRYETLRQLGRGGLGAVYLARDLLADGSHVALKVCHANVGPEELLREFRILRELRHPGLARAFDVGRLPAGREAYFTMEYVKGNTLETESERLRARFLDGDPEPLLAVFHRVAQTLSYIHQRGLLHLDVKPANIVLTAEGLPKLIDFGLFQSLEFKDRSYAHGTPHYCAPEIRSGSEFDRRADLYSLGVALYYVLTGEYPESERPLPADWVSGLGVSGPGVSGPGAALAGRLQDAIERLLQPAPAQRFGSAEAFTAALEELAPSLTEESYDFAFRELDFCGRRSELGVFLTWLEELERGRGVCSFVVEGEPGIGKSRFLEACSTEALCAGFHVFSAVPRSLKSRDGLRSLVDQLCILCTKDRLTLGNRFGFLLTHLGLADHAPSRRELQRLTSAEIRARVFRELLELAAGVGCPVLVAIDDPESADTELVELLRTVSERAAAGIAVEGLCLGFLVTRCSAGELELPEVSPLVLKPLRRKDLLAALTTFVPTLGREESARLAAASQGNPGLLRQLAYHRLTAETSDLAGLAGSLDHVVAHRLKRADDVQRTLFLHLSLLREPVDVATLTGVVQRESGVVRQALKRLEETGFLVDGSRGMFLVRILGPDNLRHVFADEEVRAAHQALGELLRNVPERRAEATHHFFLAGMGAEGLELGLAALRGLREAGRIAESAALVREALPYATPGSELARQLLESLADSLEKSGEFAQAAEHCREALATNPVDLCDRMRLHRKLASLHQRVGNNAQAESAFGTALELMEQAGDLEETLFLLHELSIFYLYREDFSQATAYAHRGLELLSGEEASSLSEESRIGHSLRLRSATGHVLLRQFDYEGAARELRASLKLCESVGSVSDTAQVLNNLGVAYYQGNRLGEALRVYARATELAHRLGNDTALFSIQCNTAAIRARRGEMTASRDVLRRIREMPHTRVSRRARLFLLYTEGLVARLELTDARDSWGECLRLAALVPDPVIERYARVYAMENEIQQGRWGSARDLLEEIETTKAMEPALAHAVEARRAYLEALCQGRTQTAIASAVPRALPLEKQGYAEAWNWIYVARALIETDRIAEAGAWLRQARSFFLRLKQHPGVLECDLALADWSLRRRDTSRAGRYLAAARRDIERHDTDDGSRAALPRLALLEARQAFQSSSEPTARVRVAELLAKARSQSANFTCLEASWLLEVVSRENGDPGAEERQRRAHCRFFRALRREDRRGYARRDPLARLGLRSAATPSAEIVHLRRAELRLQSLSLLRELFDPERALSLILDACGVTKGALLTSGGGPEGDGVALNCLAMRGEVPLSGKDAVGAGPGSAQWLRVDVPGRNGAVVGQLVVRSQRCTDDDVSGFLELAAQGLAGLMTAASAAAANSRDRQATPLLVEAAGTTMSLAARTLVTSESPRLQEILSLIQRTRESELPVLLTGESGVGKDRIARWVHSLSPRRDKPFLVVDCSSIPDGLWEAELFGHEKGAFTGADVERRGYLLAARGGTIYLDNVDTVSADAQAKLLRVLEEGEVRPVGGEELLSIDARFIASSQRDLQELSRRDEFRSDLYFRLSGVSVTIPPLRERAEDIPALVAHFRRELPHGGLEFTPCGLRALQAHGWPGNVRELESLVRRLALTSDEAVDADGVASVIAGPGTGTPFPRWIFEGKEYKELIHEVKKEYLLYLFERFEGDVEQIAQELGTGKRNVYLRLAQVGVKPLRSRR